MSYSRLKLHDLKSVFGVTRRFQDNLFQQVPARPVSDLLRQVLAANIKFALDQGTEKARSEFIIAPVMSELRRQAEERISIFSGIEFNVDKKRGLAGWCDFLVSRSSYQADLEAPVVVAVEAKQQDFEGGTTQCMAEMVAARIFNEREGNNFPNIYGCVTSGDIWRFVALRGDVTLVETNSYNISEDLERILGILWAMAFDEVPQ